MNESIQVGIIGGSGLYEMEALRDVTHVSLDTPFGAPSDTGCWADNFRYGGWKLKGIHSSPGYRCARSIF